MIDVIIPKIDIDILKIQHEELIEKLWDEPDAVLWGLVEMLDYVLDMYEPDLDKQHRELLDSYHNNNEGK